MISWDARTLSLDLPVGMARTEPDYHDREDITVEYARTLHAHYHRDPDEPAA